MGKLNKAIEDERAAGNLDELRDMISIGVHFDCEVTRAKHVVGQAFCGALPVGRSKVKNDSLWAPLASLVLDGIYEATFWAHVLYMARFRVAKGLEPRPLYL